MVKYLKIYTDKELLQIREDIKETIISGKMIGRIEPYLTLEKDINKELSKRLK